jgi:hypothetical protein
MQVYEFTIVIPEIDDDIIDSIAGRCPDSGVGTCEGTTFVDFDREAKSLGDAIDSAVADLKKLGIRAIRVTIDMPQPVAP